MKIGFFVTKVASARGFENNVSAHVQLPLHTMKLLLDAGHIVQLITTKIGDDHTLPHCLPSGIKIHQVTDGRRRGKGFVMEVGFKKGIRPFKLIQQVFQIKQIIKMEKYDVIHFFGSNRMAYFSGLMRLVGVETPIILTSNMGRFPEPFWFATKYLWRKITLVLTSTTYFKNTLNTQGIVADVLKHGIVRNIKNEIGKIAVKPPHRVLFWRDPSKENGADICVQVYKELAPRFPDVSFDLAIRPHWDPVEGLEDLCEEYPNINIHHFPYRHDITLPKLLAESICVLLPFKSLSTHPQFSIMESMAFGCAVVTTSLDSNVELIHSGRNGYLVPVDDIDATKRAVEALLINRKNAIEIGARASESMQNNWNWEYYTSNLVKNYIWSINRLCQK